MPRIHANADLIACAPGVVAALRNHNVNTNTRPAGAGD